MHHHKWGSFPGAIALGWLAVGCPQPADLENPDAYNKNPPGGPTGAGGSAAGSGTTAGAGGSGAPPNCESDCINKLFTVGSACAICHYANVPPDALSLGKLDLSPGYTARMRDKPAAHVDINFAPFPAGTCPSADLLINTTTPGESWLWKKVNGDQGTCGTRMPQPPATIGATQIACVKDYIECVAQKPIGGGSGGATGGAGGGAGGGGMAGGSGAGGT